MNDFNLEKFILEKFMPVMVVIMLGGVTLLICSLPFTAYKEARTVQKALANECNSHYTLLEVASAGDKLMELCKIKNQQLTIR